MADCDDRQLTQAQREEGFQQLRGGVIRALRPFTGTPTLPNLLDYINREMFPVLQQTRNKTNDVYRQVTENAPSGNPLLFYFSTNTANADPTVGRVRFDNAQQNLSTTIRVSETNGRLASIVPWLDVMAGSATSPLGTVTLTDAINPGRFVRFDLESMTDQGAYWDLTVTPIESSHENPFVDDNPIAIGFIPGVASDGATVPPGSVAPMGPYTVLGNPTGSTAAPTEIGPIDAMTVLGRASSAANVNDIGPPTAASTFLRANTSKNVGSTTGAAPSSILFSSLFQTDLPNVQDGQMYMNVNGAFSAPLARNVSALAGPGLLYNGSPGYRLEVRPSTSVVIDTGGGTNEVQRAALTGDVAASQNSNTLTIQPLAVTTGTIADDAVTDGKLRNSTALSVIGRSANSSGDPADIAAVAASGGVLRESGNALGFGTIATAAIADAAVTNAKLANMAAGTQKGRTINGGTGAPVDLTGLEQGQNIRREFFVTATTLGMDAPGTYSDVALDQRVSHFFVNPSSNGDVIFTGFAHGSANTGVWFLLQKEGSDGRVVLKHNQTSATANQIWCPSDADYVLTRSNDAVLLWYGAGRWRVMAAPARVLDADYGDITVSGGGTVFTVDNDVVTNAKAADMAAATIKGRAFTAGTGDPTDLTGLQVGQIVRRGQYVIDSASSGVQATYAVNGETTQLHFAQSGAVSLAGMTILDGKTLEIHVETGVAGTVTIEHESTSAGANAQRFRCPDATGLVLYANDSATVTYFNNRWRVVAVARSNNALRLPYYQTATLAPGTYNDVALEQRTHWYEASLNADGDVIITGLAQAGGNTGGFIHLVKIGASQARRIILKHEDTGSLAANRIWLPNSTDYVLTQAQHGVTLQYTARWVVVDRPPMYRLNSAGSNFYRSRLNFVAGTAMSLAMADDTTNDEIDLTVNWSGITVKANGAGPVAWTAFDIDDSSTIDFSFANNGSGELNITAAVIADSIGNTHLRNSAAVSVIGRSANSSGDPADIAASANNRVLVRRSDALSFEQIVDGDVAAGTITLGKIVGINANTVIGNNTGSATNPVEISVGTNSVLGRVAGNIVAAQLVTGQIADANVTLAKMADLAQSRIIGRAEGAGTGVPTALTPAQVVAIIDGEAVTWTANHSFTGTLFSVSTSSNVGIASGGTLTLSASSTVTVGSPLVVNNTVDINSPGVIDIDATSNISIASGATLTLAASSTVTVGSPLEVNNTALFTSSIAQTATASSGSVGLDNVAIGNVAILRLTASNWILSGMVPARDGQTVFIVNAHASDPGTILLQSLSSSAANRFAGVGTSRSLRPQEMAQAWYDGADDRWRLLCRDDADL